MIEYLYYLSAPLLLFSGIPQTFRLLQTKKSSDISLATYACTWLAVMILLLNSIQVGASPLIWSNGVSLFTLTLNLFLIIKYRYEKIPLV
jgi:uncharacterized protein with PQ loop repeat